MDLEKMNSEYELLETNRKFAAVLRVARAVHDFESRLQPYIVQENTQINLEKIERELTSGSEEFALFWMKAFWTGEMPPGTNAFSMLWLTDSRIKEAIVCALAESSFSNYVLDERYRTVKAA